MYQFNIIQVHFSRGIVIAGATTKQPLFQGQSLQKVDQSSHNQSTIKRRICLQAYAFERDLSKLKLRLWKPSSLQLHTKQSSSA
jgi:hypothetical protein